MKLSKRTILGLLFVLLVGQFFMPGENTSIDYRGHTNPSYDSQINDNLEFREPYQIDAFGPRNDFIISQDTETGIFDPVVIEQSGYYDTGIISAKTDTHTNDFTSVPIDDASNWVASQAKVELSNLNREYAENGTFNEGVSGNNTYPDSITVYPNGWDVDWYNPEPAQTLITYYDNESDYVTVENQGEIDTVPSITYWHYHNTWNLWNQTIINQPYSDNMTLSFSYNYASGIVNNLYAVGGNVVLAAWIENSTYSAGYLLVDLMYDTPERNSWYDVTIYNITDAPAEFTFSIGLYIMADNYDSFELNPGGDYDDDGAIDGAHTKVFKVLLDDVSLVSLDPPTPEEIELSFHVGNYNTTITGIGGNGSASIDYQYWNDSQLAVGVSANVSISFDYQVWVLEHLFSDSSWTTHPTQKGVTYSVDVGKSADLSTFTYIGSDLTTTFENFTVFIYLPQDWDNATIYDPFTNDVTGSCTVESGLVTVPITLLTRLGWWEIDFQSPNYAKSIQTQIDQGSNTWTDTSVFRSGNDTRTTIEIGTLSTSPVLDGLTNVTWMLPNGTIWTEESLTNGTGNIVTSSRWTLGGMNTTAGQWSIDVQWSNGTEVAYDYSILEMYHSANLIPLNTEIETDEGLVVTNFLQYVDIDNNEYLMDESANIVGNWSSTQVAFDPDLLRNRWTADFDTSLVSAGHYLVIVNASLPYFDDVSCQFTINSTYVTNFELFDVSDIPIETGLNENYDVISRYELDNGTGIAGATIQTSFTGPENGLIVSIDDSANNGNYTVTITGLKSGTFSVSIVASKDHHYQDSDYFTIIVGATNTELVLVNGTADYTRLGSDYRLVLQYVNSTGYGLVGADLTIVDVSPSTGISLAEFIPFDSGYYSIFLTPSEAKTYTIVVKANLTNHVTQITTFTLTASETPTVLNIDSAGATVSIDMQHTVQFVFQDDENNYLDNAIITVLNLEGGLIYSNVVEIPGGLYNITFTPLEIGTYQIAFRASLENYHNSTVGFTLIVKSIPTVLYVVEQPTSNTVLFSSEYVISLVFNRTDTEENIFAAFLNISMSQEGVVDWDIVNEGAVYTIIFKAIDIGRCRVYIIANKTNHIDGFIEFELDIIPITTSVDEYNLIDDFVYGRPVNLDFDYQMSNDTGITSAEVTPSGSGAQWVIIEESGNGLYVITITPLGLGSYDVILTFTKDGFETSTSALLFTVVSVQIEITDIQGLTATEGTTTILSLRIVESDTGLAVSGALVQFQIITDTDPGEIRTLDETSDGVYSTSYVMPSSETNASVKIYVTVDNYVLDSDFFESELIPTISEAVVVLRTVQTITPFLLLLGVVVVGLLARKVYNRRKLEQNIEALLVKRRFEDVRGLLGVIVLHKHSGIPIYSKIIKGGLNEDLISGFISAITQFRAGFEMNQSNWVVVPISDIIRSVATENLLCAFITLATPSKSQELKMIDFAEAVGFIFDKEYTEPPMMALDEGTEIQFANLFDDHLDGQFLRKFMIAELSGLPSNPRCVGSKIEAISKGGAFDLAELASQMTACGIEEARAYKIIWDAIENDSIITVDAEVEEIVITETVGMDSEIESIEDTDDGVTIIDVSDTSSEAGTIDYESDIEESIDSEHSVIDSEIETKEDDNGYD